jgi:hypothetical protein
VTGPPPTPPELRRRRNAQPGFEQLPAEGRQGEYPQWPFDSATNAERKYWRKLWKLPQAVKWEEMQLEELVALFVRVTVKANEDLDTKLIAESRQLDAKLGVSAKAMRDLRWEVAERKPDAPVLDETPREVRAYIPEA